MAWLRATLLCGVGSGVSKLTLRQSTWTCVLLLSLLAACGSSRAAQRAPASSPNDDALLRDPVLDAVLEEEAARRAAHRAPAEPRSAKTTPSTAPGQSAPTARTVGVRGITGSLTGFEVEEAMNMRRAELLACVEQRPRALGHVAGDISFHIDVDGQGQVERVLVMQSDIGYTPLEDCLAQVVKSAPFRPPAGAQRAETQWRMSVDPLARAAEPIDTTELEQAIAHQAAASYDSCSIAKARRFLVNGYLWRGKLRPVSVRVPWRGPGRTQDDSAEQLACLAQALEHWTRWPKSKGYAKLGFELHWVAPPPPPPKRGRARRRR